MRTSIPEKILKIIDDIDQHGNVPITHLTVLKKWFEKRGRLPSFALWIARRAAGRKGKTGGEFGALLNEARALLGSVTETEKQAAWHGDKQAIADFCRRARAAQNECHAPGRIVQCRPLLLVEKGLALWLEEEASPSDGYELAAAWARNHDPKHGDGLNGPSRGKLEELVRFMFTIEALEEE